MHVRTQRPLISYNIKILPSLTILATNPGLKLIAQAFLRPNPSRKKETALNLTIHFQASARPPNRNRQRNAQAKISRIKDNSRRR